MSERRDIPEPGELVYAPRPSWAPAFFAFAAALAVCGIFAEGFMVRGWIYSIIGVVVLALRPAQHDPGRDPRLLPPAPQAEGPRGCPPRRDDQAPAGLNQSGVMPEVAPSEVQTRTMSRIERTPTSSAASKTTRWRMPRPDISAAARSRLQSGEAAITPLAHVVADQLGVGVLAAPERDAGCRAR